MDIIKTDTPDDEGEISLNDTPPKRSLSALNVVTGHGPWQYRHWLVFFAASLYNAVVVFSSLFMPSQTYCLDSTGASMGKASFPETNSTGSSPQIRSYVKNNASVLHEHICNSTYCKTNVIMSDDSSAKLLYEIECWNSQVEIFVKCIYMIACVFSCVLVYFSTRRYGRRPVALMSCLFLVVSSLATSWAHAPIVFLILRFIVTLGIFSIYLISAFSLMECVDNDFKLLYFFTGHLGWGLAHFLLPAVAWMSKDWMTFNIILGAIALFLSIVVKLGPESPSSYPNRQDTRVHKMRYGAFMNGSSHFCCVRPECEQNMDDISTKSKLLCFVHYFFFCMISFTTTFIYFATKWHPEWFKVAANRISFAFLGTTEVAAIIIMLFLTCVVTIKYLLACVSVMTSVLMIIIFSRTKGGTSTSSALLFTVTAFFASAAWTLLLAKTFCHKMSNLNVKFNLIITGVVIFAGSLAASVVILKASNQDMLLVLSIPNFVFGIATAFLPDMYFGTIS